MHIFCIMGMDDVIQICGKTTLYALIEYIQWFLSLS